MRRFGYKKEL